MTETPNDVLEWRIRQLEEELDALRLQQNVQREKREGEAPKIPPPSLPLELKEYVRYGRQMILPQVGLPGQLALKSSSVLVIGAGGLGCPVLLYLVASGIGLQSTYLVLANHCRDCRNC